jgi:hypothetical protein
MSEPNTTTDLPVLRVDAWEPTRRTLHMWLQIVGKIRMINADPVNHWWHVALQVSSRGFTTGPVTDAGGVFEIELDLQGDRLLVRRDDGRSESFALGDTTVADFYGQLTSICARFGVDARIHAVPNEVEHAVPFAEDTADPGFDPEQARTFWRQLVVVQRQLSAFRGGFRGKSSPVHFFWGALDLAVTRFSGRPAPAHPGGVPNCPDSVMVESYSAELSSAGFWPGGGEEGAYYAYRYPDLPGYRDAAVPDEAHWDDALGEFILPFEAVRRSSDPDALVQEFLRATFDAAEGGDHWG